MTCEECGREDGHWLNCERAPKSGTAKAPRRTKKEQTDE